MKFIWYNLIITSSLFVFILVPVSVLIIIRNRDVKRRVRPTRLQRLRRWVAVNAFSGIIKKTKNDSNEETRWLFGDIDLTDEKELLSEIFTGLLATFFGILVSAEFVFCHFLLLDVTYSCSDNENTKECFENKFWKTAWSKDPIDCNSATVQNGTVQVVCYKLVFNLDLASGVSYGVFKLTIAVLNVASTLILIVTKPKTVTKIQAILGIVFVGLFGAFITILSSSLGVSFISGNLVIIIQIFVAVAIVSCFVFWIPWKDLIAIKVRYNNEQAIGLENSAANAPLI